MGLRKFLKKARKALHLPAVTLGNVAKVGLAAAGGGIPAVGAMVVRSKLKSAAVGGIKRVLRTKAEKALAKRVMAMTPQGRTNPPAQTMPGGAPLARSSSSRGRTARGTSSRRRRKAKAPIRGMSDEYNRYMATHSAKDLRRGEKRDLRRARKAASGRKRQPPKGGKDFKALSVAWRAAGKPGRWIDWVKAH
jgi:hypothetical protein